MSDARDAKRETARAEMRADVKAMREEGVVRWGDLIIGPPPAPRVEDMTPEQRAKHIEALNERDRQRKHGILFASTGMRPKLPKRAPESESVVQRSRPQRRDDDDRKSA